jgi:Fe-S cluster assembly iron-binding protein IscA
MELAEDTTTLVSLTPGAAEKVKELMAEDPEESLVLRVAIQGGGCSGFKYDNPNAQASCGCGHSFTVEEGADAPAAEHGGACGSGCSH